MSKRKWSRKACAWLLAAITVASSVIPTGFVFAQDTEEPATGKIVINLPEKGGSISIETSDGDESILTADEEGHWGAKNSNGEALDAVITEGDVQKFEIVKEIDSTVSIDVNAEEHYSVATFRVTTDSGEELENVDKNSLSSSYNHNLVVTEETQNVEILFSEVTTEEDEFVTNSKGITVKKSLLCDDPDCLEKHIGVTLDPAYAGRTQVIAVDPDSNYARLFSSTSSRSVRLMSARMSAPHVGMTLSGANADVLFQGIPGTAGDFAVTINDGELSGISGIGWCIDHTAANPGEGAVVQCTWSATCTAISGNVATWSIVLTPPGVTDGVSWVNGCLSGYQHVGLTATLQFEEPKGNVEVWKSSSKPEITNGNPAYSLAGAIYGVYDGSGNEVTRMTTNANGYAKSADIPAGTYTVKEIQASEGYELDRTGHSATVTSGNTAKVYSSEVPVGDPLGILVKKVDSVTGEPIPQGSASLAGAEFTVTFYVGQYSTDPAQSGVTPQRTWVLKTDDDGYCDLSDAYKVSGDDFYYNNGDPTLPIGTFTIQETKAPEGYLVDENVYTYNVLSENDGKSHIAKNTLTDAEKALRETAIMGGISVQKYDIETGEATPQGGGSFAGIKYNIISLNDNAIVVNGNTYNKNDVVTTLTTNANGFATTSNDLLPFGKYKVVEISAGEGYLNSGKIETEVSIEEDGVIVSTRDDIQNNVIRGGVKVQKYDIETGKAEPQGAGSFDGIKFDIVNLNDNEVIVEGNSYGYGDVVATLTADENGFVQSANDLLPYGDYKLVEVSAGKGYLNAGKIEKEFSVSSNLTIIDLGNNIQNYPIRGDIAILKFKGDTSEELGDDAEPLEGAEFTITSKTTGKVVTKVVSDEHGVATTKSDEYPRGRLIYDTYTITETKTPEGYRPIQPFEVTVEKNGVTVKYIYKQDVPIQAPIQLVKKDSSTDKVIPIENTIFRILDENMNVVTMTTHYPQTVIHSEFYTDETGTCILPERLQYGKYYIEEVQAPYGYLKGELLEFNIDKYHTWEDPIIVEYEDDNAMGKIKVVKSDDFTKTALAGAKYAIFADEDIITGDTTKRYSKGDLVTTFVTGEDGVGLSSDLFIGKYYLQEIQAPDGYCLDNSRYEFEIEYKDQLTPLVYVTKSLSNKPTELQINKTDIDGLKFEGVEFTLTPVNSTGTVYSTNSEGIIDIKYVKHGIYKLEETNTLPGYVLDKTTRYITVDNNGFIFESDKNGNALDETGRKSYKVSLDLVNDYIKVDFSKSDVTGDSEVPGAKLQVLNENGDVVYEWTSSEEVHRINKIPAGQYTLHEEITPNGYVTANDIKFIIEETGEVQTVTMIDKQLFVTKYDITGQTELKGASLSVVDLQGNVIDSWESTTEKHAVSGLKAGETYILKEEIAPNGYVKASDIEFTVLDDGKVQYVDMKDKYVELSKVNVAGEEVSGAELTVRDEDENIIDSWVSSEESHKIKNLEVGKTYTLTEELAPEGYVTANMITFTVEDNDENDKLTMVDERFVVNKVDSEGEPVVCAKMQIVSAKTRNIVDEWITDGNPHYANNLIVGQKYILREVEAPTGYVLGSEVEFDVTEDGIDGELTFINKQVFVNKFEVIESDAKLPEDTTEDSEGVTDEDTTLGDSDNTQSEENSNEATTEEDENRPQLVGTKLEVLDLEGNSVDSWEQTEEKHAISGLMVGETYILKEVEASTGYAIASPIEFTVEDNGTDQTITMLDKQVIVSKTDITGKKEISGAELTVTDKETGEVIDKWVSDKVAHPVENLEVGKTYILHEEVAPDGYIVANDIEFTVEDDFITQEITMKDDHTKVLISKQDATTGKELPGAKFEIRDTEGNVVVSWTSTNKPMLIEKIPVGKYILHEDLAPLGYELAQDIEFEVKATGEIQKVTMKDELTPTIIVKTGEPYVFGFGILIMLIGILGMTVALCKRRKLR